MSAHPVLPVGTKPPFRSEHAVCTPATAHLFYPPRRQEGIEAKRLRVAKAKARCERCPVRTACLEHALRFTEPGIWGGTTEDERDRIRAERNRAARNAA